MPPKKTADETGLSSSPQSVAKDFMVAHKNEVLNFEESDKYIVSTGSLKLDTMLNGGIVPGLVRLVGVNSGGKTSESLEMLRQFFLVKPNGRGVFFKAEGRLSDSVQARSGVKFVVNPDDWIEGTCLIFEGNVYESVAGFMITLIQNNPTKTNYFFIVDSLDGLILRDDLVSKSIEDTYKVAGPAVIGKKLMQRVFGPLVKHGHIMVATSQVTAQPKIDPYAPVQHRSFPSSAGNWALHYPDVILEFTPRYKKSDILENPKADYDPKKNPIIGHEVNITIRKSDNEKMNATVSYPVRHGRTGGKSIWIEREVGDLLITYFMTLKGSWLSFSESILADLQKIDPEVPAQIQGSGQLYSFLEKNPKITEYLFHKFRTTLVQRDVWTGEGDPFDE